MEASLYKVETFVPQKQVELVIEALNQINALTIGGNYDHCIFQSSGIGSWRPLDGADPFLGTVGEVCYEKEMKLEFTCKKERIKQVLETIKKVHPYEVPVINVLPVFSYEDMIEDKPKRKE